MSRMAALVFLATAASQAPLDASPQGPAASGLTAEQAMANERATLSGAMAPAGEGVDCHPVREGEILVCRHGDSPSPRLPMPEARAVPGEVVRHPGEIRHPGDPGPPGEPSKLGETIGKAFGLLRSAVTGADRGF
jgi:hypothetical protein